MTYRWLLLVTVVVVMIAAAAMVALWIRRNDQQRGEARYDLLTDARLQFLGMTHRSLALNETQKEQVQAIKDGL